MTINCKFKIHIKKTGMFQCAADANGWAWLWNNKDETENPCGYCKKYKSGKGKFVSHELKSGEFWDIAGGMITPADWLNICMTQNIQYDSDMDMG